jgi:glutathione synthase/RimK-type ligase-like ATP-grasp enzyme
VVVLEVNPNGRWAWIEDATGLPIAAAIADALTWEES